MTGPTREWVTFADPKDAKKEWRVDVTFLLSSWDCIFGRGCQGVLDADASDMVQGCCSYGAHFSDNRDRNHVVKMSKLLTDEEWQFRAVGKKKGIYAQTGNEYRTRLVDDACIFLNRPGFAAGPGCALHVYGMRHDIHHSELKPDVCWQLPLRAIEDDDDETGKTVVTLTEFARDGWGEGGEDFHWWCTEAPEAFVGKEPVYRSLEAEMRKMTGDPLYDEIAEYLDQRLQGRGQPAPHPAESPVVFVESPKRRR